MANREKANEVIRLVSDRFRIDFQSENLAGWQSVLDSMTNNECDAAIYYLNHDYTGEWHPQPAVFKSWAKIGEEKGGGQKMKPRHFHVDDDGRAHAYMDKDGNLAMDPVKNGKVEIISRDERRHRLDTIRKIRDGEIKLRDDIPLREQLGWSQPK